MGNSLNRRAAVAHAEQERAAQVENVRTLITAELVNVAAGLMGALDLVNAAIISGVHYLNGASIALHSYLPRAMPYTEGLEEGVLMLSPDQVDVLAVLRSNLTLTRSNIEDILANGAKYRAMGTGEVKRILCHDMDILAQAFERIAPTRKLALGEKAPELASALLRKMVAADDKAG